MAWILQMAVMLSLLFIFITVFLAFVRLILGPSLPDRVVALDMMTVAIVSVCGLEAVQSGDPAFLDVAVVLALVGFLATVALARFADRQMLRGKNQGDEPE